MQVITLKLQDSTARKMEKTMKAFDYVTKTDFIREAIRDKLRALEREKALLKLKSLQGKAPVKYSDEEFRKIREKVGEELFKEFNRK